MVNPGQHICALFQTECGDLVVYDCEALSKVVAALPRRDHLRPASNLSAPPPAPPPLEVIDGFTASQWASYAKLKASIASRMCRENGALKKQALFQTNCSTPVGFSMKTLQGQRDQKNNSEDRRDELFEHDPWHSEKEPANTMEDAETSANSFLPGADAWSTWKVSSATPYVSHSPGSPSNTKLDDTTENDSTSFPAISADASGQDAIETDACLTVDGPPDSNRSPEDSMACMETFDQFIETLASKVRDRVSGPMCPGMFSSRVRDIMRPHQTTFWQQWTQRFHGGTGDPALATAAQLLLFLDAVAQWYSMCQAKGEISKEQMQGHIKKIDAARDGIAKIAF